MPLSKDKNLFDKHKVVEDWKRGLRKTSIPNGLLKKKHEDLLWTMEDEQEQLEDSRASNPTPLGGDEKRLSAKQLQCMIEENNKEKRKKLVNKFISALTLHGYAQFHEASGVRKLLWGLILGAMAVFIFRLTYLSYHKENYYKHVIEFETNKVASIDFPTVTICNFSPVYSKEIYKRFPVNITENEFRLFYHLVVSNRRSNRFEQLNHIKLQDYVFQELRQKGYASYKDVLQLFEKNKERDINSMLITKIMKRHRCLFEDEPCHFKKMFETVYRHKTQSLCKQFNPYRTGQNGLVSSGNDHENGFFMFWDISGEHYFDDYGVNGLLMEIHPYGSPHHLIDHRRSIYLEPGVCTNIDLEEVITKRLPPPFKPNCGERPLMIIRNYPYSKSVCEVDCHLKAVVNHCGCVPDQFSDYVGNTRICKASEMKCMFGISSSHCHKCPVSCDAIDYRVFTSRLGIGNDWVYKTLQRSLAWKNHSPNDIEAYINRNIVGFRIGFKTLEQQFRIYKEAVPWYERISMLGGIMGLLLGFSVITGFELLFFLFDYFYTTIRYQCTISTISEQKQLN